MISIYVVLAAVMGLGTLGLGTYNLVGTSDISEKQQQLDGMLQQRKTNKELVSKLEFIDERTKNANTYKETKEWEKLIAAIAQATPTSIQLSGIKIDASKGATATIDLTGKTTVRRDVILFRDKLASDKVVADPQIASITDITTLTGTEYNFSIKAGAIK